LVLKLKERLVLLVEIRRLLWVRSKMLDQLFVKSEGILERNIHQRRR